VAKSYKIAESDGATEIAKGITSILDALFSLAKVAFIWILLILVWYNRALFGQYLAQWMGGVTHLSLPGISLDRQTSAQETVVEITRLRNPDDPDLRQTIQYYASAAITRASRNAPAISGARILWVDGNPENNALEASVLSDMGIDVQRAFNTSEALVLLSVLKPDLIISNVYRDRDDREPLKNCPAHYFEVPPDVPNDLSKLNADIMAGVGRATGFSMAEAISKVDPQYTDHRHPRIIFYTLSSGGIVADQCARIVTNRVDVLLNGVVSALEEIRWQNLQPPNQPPKP
jgi:CheY-like chemotaxis protein